MGTSKSCSKYEGGTCRSGCVAPERLVSARCMGNHRYCCAKPCIPQKSCAEANGLCVENKRDCRHGILDHKGCLGYKCMCCKPLSKEVF